MVKSKFFCVAPSKKQREPSLYLPAAGRLGVTNTEKGTAPGYGCRAKAQRRIKAARLILIDSKEARINGEGKSTPGATLESQPRVQPAGLAVEPAGDGGKCKYNGAFS